MALVAASACRLSYLVAAHTVGYGGVLRHHVETTATIFALLGGALALMTRQATAEAPHPAAPWHRGTAARWLLPSFCGAAFVLYWPVLFIGPLSDDFVLMHRTSSWDVSAVSSTLFRPVPLLLWSAVLASGAGTVGLHALNVLLHGVNAWLAMRVLDAWMPWQWGIVAGLLMVTAPIAPEAVAWASGIFDVSAATFVLASVLAARRYGSGQPSAGTRALFAATSLLAVLCKETAAVAPVLALLCAHVDRSAPGRSILRRDALAVIGAIAAFGLVRMLVHPEPALFQISKYAVQRTLFAAFGSLAAPFHTDFVTLAPWIAVGSTVLVICVWTVFFVTPPTTRDLATIARGLLWILIAIAAQRAGGCPDVAVENPPDTVRGAYVFRNGLFEALAARGIALVDSPQRPDCAFSWSAERGGLMQR